MESEKFCLRKKKEKKEKIAIFADSYIPKLYSYLLLHGLFSMAADSAWMVLQSEQ